MPALPFKPRVLQRTTTEGLGSILLGDSVAGFQTFAQAFGANQAGVRFVVQEDGGAWEEVIGDYDHATQTLSRLTILSSSNGGSKINWSTGTRNVMVTVPASEAMSKAESLAGLASASEARTNLGLGSVAVLNSGTGSGDVRTNTQNDARFGIVGTGGTQVRTNDQNDARFSQVGTLAAPAGFQMLQLGGAVPSGWTRVNETEDLVYRGARSGDTVGNLGGSWDQTSGVSVSGTVITTTTMPQHNHTPGASAFLVPAVTATPRAAATGPDNWGSLPTTGNTGSDGSHGHALSNSQTWRPRHRIAAKIQKD